MNSTWFWLYLVVTVLIVAARKSEIKYFHFRESNFTSQKMRCVILCGFALFEIILMIHFCLHADQVEFLLSCDQFGFIFSFSCVFFKLIFSCGWRFCLESIDYFMEIFFVIFVVDFEMYLYIRLMFNIPVNTSIPWVFLWLYGYTTIICFDVSVDILTLISGLYAFNARNSLKHIVKINNACLQL